MCVVCRIVLCRVRQRKADCTSATERVGRDLEGVHRESDRWQESVTRGDPEANFFAVQEPHASDLVRGRPRRNGPFENHRPNAAHISWMTNGKCGLPLAAMGDRVVES